MDTAVANAGAALHGTVMVGVLLAAEDVRSEGYPSTIAAAVIVLTLYWLMSLYAHTVGTRLRTGERLDRRMFLHSCSHELPVIEGAALPVIVLAVAWVAGVKLSSGVAAALGTAAASVVVLELLAGRQAGLPARTRWAQGAAGVVFGLGILALKIVLH